MLVAGIDVRFCPNAHDPVKVVDIHVDKDSVEPCQDLLALWLETLWERDVRGHWEQLKLKQNLDKKAFVTQHELHLLIIDLRLHPVHQEGDVLGSREVDWLLVLDTILEKRNK